MMTSDHRKVHDWLTKDYPTGEQWKNIGKELYLVSNGDCALTRHRLADTLRRALSKLQPGPASYQRWNDEFTEIITVEVESPTIGGTNEAYIDWIRLADYLLLAAASTWPRLEEENQRRKTMYDQAMRGYEARSTVKEIVEYLEAHPDADSDEVKAKLGGREIMAIHLTKAKQVVSTNATREIVEQPPELPTQLDRYKTLYF